MVLGLRTLPTLVCQRPVRRMLAVLAKDVEGELWRLDCSHIKLQQHGTNPQGVQTAQTMGRTKGGLNTKLSAVVDTRGLAVSLSLAAGPQHDQHAVLPVLTSARGCCIVADKGVDADVFRTRLRTQRIRCCSHPSAVAYNRLASIAVNTGAAIRSKTSSAG